MIVMTEWRAGCQTVQKKARFDVEKTKLDAKMRIDNQEKRINKEELFGKCDGITLLHRRTKNRVHMVEKKTRFDVENKMKCERKNSEDENDNGINHFSPRMRIHSFLESNKLNPIPFL